MLFAFLDVAQVVRVSGSKLKPLPKESQNIVFSCTSMVVGIIGCMKGEADDRVKQTRGSSGQTKDLNQSLPLNNNNALDIIITTQIY